jgi:hypothetical protein
LGFDFTVEYKPGSTNVVADALSRCDTEAQAEVSTISTPSFCLFDDLRTEFATNPELAALRQAVQEGVRGDKWTVVDDLVRVGGWIYIAPSSVYLHEVLAGAHNMGHEGIQKTLHRLCATFFIPGARGLVKNFVCACPTCQKNKAKQLHPAGLLQPLEVPTMIWADISMDFVERFPKVNGKSVVLTVVDRFSKFAHFIPMGHPYSATSVARAFFAEIVCLHGLPNSIVSDRDPTCTSNFGVNCSSTVSLHMSTTFHPQSDGQSEAVNKVIAMYLRCLSGDRPRNWVQWLPWAEFCYNSFQSSLRTSSFRTIYGCDPQSFHPMSLVQLTYRQCINHWLSETNFNKKSETDWNSPSNISTPFMTRSTGR